MSQNLIIKGRKNLVKITFEFDGEFANQGLNYFDEIFLKIGDETYSTVSNSSNLYIQTVVSAGDTLILNIGLVTSLEANFYELEIWGTNINYPAPEGFLLSGCCVKKLGFVKVCEC